MFYEQNNPKDFYSILCEVCGPRSKSSHQFLSKKGLLLTTDKKIKDRWVEHFSDLLNIETDADIVASNEIDQLPIEKSLDEPLHKEELYKAISNMKPRKSPGPGGILPETVKYGIMLQRPTF